ncbi:hypothetical protein ABT160_02575 [Streptomyces sp. NPDC001941]|uniref:hypothetical protein n=1 Tax=Streptomyces sp. NPDC001941 TaxID=3154659 RepID=UPI00332ED000
MTQTTGRYTADTITDQALDELYATVRRLNYRAQRAESTIAQYERAVVQWEISERGTYIPHASLRAIGRVTGTDLLGSVRHLQHFQRVEQAEAAIARVRAHLRYVLDYQGPGHSHLVPGRWDKDGSPCDHCARLAEARAALDEPKEGRP